MNDSDFMREALKEAAAAAAAGEVPIGAVAVKDGVIVARGRNRVEELHSVSAHAEFQLLHELEKISGDWRMSDYTFYVTKEPCPMCAGMLINSRVRRVVFGTPDPAAGGMGGAFNLNDVPGLLWHCEVTAGILADESLALIREFFRRRRSSSK
ncbi:MAG: nucleoside deaminase [Lentisphaeria bacterium]|nr:nucleoside deaminase [Lentisphaeria bacterium]